MALSKHAKRFHENVSHDLRVLATVLADEGLSVSGDEELMVASRRLLASKSSLLTIEVPELALEIEPPRRILPSGAKIQHRVFATIVLHQNLNEAAKGESLKSIAWNSVAFFLLDEAGRVVASWHLDQHNYANVVPQPCHPRFHWQFGGWKLKQAPKPKGIVITEGPRYFSPPLDAVLAVDFLLSHFNGPKWSDLRKGRPEYRQVVQNSQTRLWRQYFARISECVASDRFSDSDEEVELLPNLM